jgi:hypothetical protein
MNKLGATMIAATVLAGLASCGDDVGPGGVTAEEARQLNEAANLLDIEDASADSLTAREGAPHGNGEEAAEEEAPAEASAPDNAQ